MEKRGGKKSERRAILVWSNTSNKNNFLLAEEKECREEKVEI
jgi:hypothetical protein